MRVVFGGEEVYSSLAKVSQIFWTVSRWSVHSRDVGPRQHVKSNQIKSLLLSHHHSTSALVSEILMSVLQTVQKNSRQFTYGQTVQKKQQTIYLWTDSAKKTTDNLPMDRQCKKTTTDSLHMDRQCKKLHWSIYSAPDSAKKTTAIYIWTVHIYRLYRRQCAKYTYIYSVCSLVHFARHMRHLQRAQIVLGPHKKVIRQSAESLRDEAALMIYVWHRGPAVWAYQHMVSSYDW